MAIVALYGSPSPASRTDVVLDHLLGQIAERGHEAVRLHLRDLPAEALLRAEGRNLLIEAAVDEVARAKILVVGTPISRSAYSGLLKAFLDLLPAAAFRGKVVVPLAIGGSLAHLLAIDYALRPLLQALGPDLILGGIFGTDRQIQYLDGRHHFEPELAVKLEEAGEQIAARLGLALSPPLPAVADSHAF
ncbi:MAG TPA: NADPH-dependent FMN reductase [Paracoccaceae bacterium]|nr:NADPH-dependent FMN reductase [Paracoccaceae bacterium]